MRLHQTAKRTIDVLQELINCRKVRMKLSYIKFTSPRGANGKKITGSRTRWCQCLNQGPSGASQIPRLIRHGEIPEVLKLKPMKFFVGDNKSEDVLNYFPYPQHQTIPDHSLPHLLA